LKDFVTVAEFTLEVKGFTSAIWVGEASDLSLKAPNLLGTRLGARFACDGPGLNCSNSGFLTSWREVEGFPALVRPGGLNSITTGAAFLAGGGASNSFFGEIWVKRDLDLVVGVS